MISAWLTRSSVTAVVAITGELLNWRADTLAEMTLGFLFWRLPSSTQVYTLGRFLTITKLDR
jgi:hypothetical protein